MENHGGTCPICGEGHLNSKSGKNEVMYKDHKRALDIYYSECDVCGSEQATAQQVRNNKRVMLGFKKEVDGLLTGMQIKALRVRLGINQSQAATIFGGGPVAFSKYENDDVTQSEAMDKLLRVAGEVSAAFTYLACYAGINSVSSSIGSDEYVLNGDGITQESVASTVKRPRLQVISSTSPEQNNSSYVKSDVSLRYGT